jgi:hypothetical protein
MGSIYKDVLTIRLLHKKGMNYMVCVHFSAIYSPLNPFMDRGSGTPPSPFFPQFNPKNKPRCHNSRSHTPPPPHIENTFKVCSHFIGNTIQEKG